MDCAQLHQRLLEYLEQDTQISASGTMCRVQLPLPEPNGDFISVFVEEGNRLRVHDGGHLLGLTFMSGPAGASASDKRALSTLVRESGLEIDSERGLVFAHADESSLMYWIWEIGRTIATASALIPTSIPRRRGGRRLGPKVAQQIIKRLMAEGIMDVIQPGRAVPGVTEQERYVDLSYTVPRGPIRLTDTTVFVIALDLDVADPITKAQRSVAAATDLGGTAAADNEVDVRVVHSVGDANGLADRAIRLLRAANEKRLLKDFSWDSQEDQINFVRSVRQDVSTLLTG